MIKPSLDKASLKKMVDTTSAKRQQGATLLGMLIIGALIVFAALVAMKMAPAYIEFMSVKKVLKAMQAESLNTMTNKEIKDSFDRRASPAYIDVIKGSDLVIEKGPNGTAVVVEYDVLAPMMGNVSVLMNFSARSDGK